MASKCAVIRGLQRLSRNRQILMLILVVTFLYAGRSIYSTSDAGGNMPSSLPAIEKPFKDTKEPERDRRTSGCNVPEMTLANSRINQHFHTSTPIVCNKDRNWISVSNGTVIFSNEAEKKHGRFSCIIEEFTRIDEDRTKSAGQRKIQNGAKLRHDFFTTECTGSSHRDKYRNIHAGVAPMRKVAERKRNPNIPGFNVVMVGFDSVSRLTFMRKMKRTFKYLTKSIGATILKRYNIVGDGTPQALIPILTGHTEWELPETRQGAKGAQHCDVYPFIWKNYSSKGYATLWAEDAPAIGTFTHRMLGFRQQPVDHYMRTFYIHAVRSNNRYSHFCLGSEHQTTVHFNYITHLFDAYPNVPKFAFAFSDLSHDEQDMLDTADGPFFEWLQSFERSGYLNNTILITMSDHGARYSHIRATQDGKMEERNPFFSVTLPHRFTKLYPRAAANLRINEDRLATPFDIYETLVAILQGIDTRNADVRNRGISLFKEIPIERTCQNAEVEPHWCNCLTWASVPTDDKLVIDIVHRMMDAFNNQTEEYREYCVPLKLDRITNASRFSPNEGLLNYHWAKDRDGRTPGFIKGYAKLVRVTYQVTFTTTPGGNIYEASADYNLDSKHIGIDLRNVGILNRYSGNGFCIHDKNLRTERYCYCKSKLTAR